MKKTISDNFNCRCRQIKLDGKRCTRRVSWLINFVVSRESWLEALRSGWPRMVRGMKEPTYSKFGLCNQHGIKYPSQYDEKSVWPRLYGLKFERPKLNSEFEEAKKMGDLACEK